MILLKILNINSMVKLHRIIETGYSDYIRFWWHFSKKELHLLTPDLQIAIDELTNYLLVNHIFSEYQCKLQVKTVSEFFLEKDIIFTIPTVFHHQYKHLINFNNLESVIEFLLQYKEYQSLTSLQKPFNYFHSKGNQLVSYKYEFHILGLQNKTFAKLLDIMNANLKSIQNTSKSIFPFQVNINYFSGDNVPSENIFQINALIPRHYLNAIVTNMAHVSGKHYGSFIDIRKIISLFSNFEKENYKHNSTQQEDLGLGIFDI